ncbi:GNAT family N-acetyltransferase [Bacillus massiliglaciei]|uniref:GNAT family N-acetyltransferase n=1 Tax=Bacillus massiliglaciei TaxID=1816693 RepID=UPI000DA63D31|nr:GNAT family N-acetyltransferase [Bacillus massiliglaciei]
MYFEPMNIAKHQKFMIQFRRDSFIISFGSDKDFGNEEEYLDWIKIKSNRFPDGFVLVMENEIPIGQLELTIKKDNGRSVGYVNLYYLIPEKRGIGMGKELHQYALQFFRKNGVTEYQLRVSPSNTNALIFYRKNGMHEMGLEQGGKVMRMKGTVL